jgi:GDP-L-fucose synthase
MRKVHEAKQAGHDTVEIWGTGTPRREFLHVDDLADGLIHLMRVYSGEDHVNIGAGRDITIGELAAMIGEIIGYQGRFVFDSSKPDGTPRKLLDTGRLTGLGWSPSIGLRDGISATYDWYLANHA